MRRILDTIFNRSTEDAEGRYLEDVLKKRRMLESSEFIHRDFALYLLGIDPMDEQDISVDGSRWHRPSSYGAIASSVLVHLPSITADSLKSFLQETKRLRKQKKVKFTKELTYLLKQSHIGSGVSMTEVGGHILSDCCKLLGCTSQNNGDQFVNFNNWDKLLQGNQDIVTTSFLFDLGSRLYDVDLNNEEQVDLAKRIVLILYNLTKEGGIMLNSGFTMYAQYQLKDFLAQIGWVEVEKSVNNELKNIWSLYSHMRKKPSIDSLKLGDLRVCYNYKSDKWGLAKR